MDLTATGMTLSGDLAVPHLLHAQVVPTVEHTYVVPLGRRVSQARHSGGISSVPIVQ